MYSVSGCSPLGLRWPCNDDFEYDRACARCEVHVRIPDEATKKLIVLRYDKRSSGSRGRAVVMDVPALGLKANDRLEPSTELADIGLFEEAHCPINLIFWRVSEETAARHRNPMFANAIGLSPNRCLTVDLLHALYLGVMKVWCTVVLWFALPAGVFGDTGGTEEEQLATAVLLFRHELMQWYKDRHRECPDENLTRLADFTAKMMGTRHSKACKTKGAETYGLLVFLVFFLGKHTDKLGSRGVRLQRAGHALQRMVGVWKVAAGDGSRCLTGSAQQRAFNFYCEHMQLMAPEDAFTPKHHIMMHLLVNTRDLGNPLLYATWRDEALNKTLKLACRETSRTGFERTLLLRMREILRPKGRPRT